ncbi:pyrroline-5-carboxylate reductase [Methylovorus sp. MM2]|uniref:pyrroline-5-carboxylate reductase n=1 Tax=Methylovorus sp. MM2 TaxID=1848038 RepID=UPI0007DFBBE4|nr:pyrroline-5-carboxylate reductase [Methylovorus sp. MM2]OAM51379.1 pyrroline-5-carboxylate reductase [Methylovorus sp. MM2]
MNISFIGGGNMARAMISGLKANGFAMESINVIDPDSEKRAQLKAEFGITTTEQLPSISNADVIVLAVKPQQLRDLAIFLGSMLQHQLVISIAAGIRSHDLARWLGGYAKIVRVMPNTPAQIQLGISALYAMPEVTSKQHEQAEMILAAVGKTLWLDEESKMDAVTAISGSGPAYIFYFIEAMQQAAVELGLSEEEARTLSLTTFTGASQLATLSSDSPSALRAQVTSKGGTTEQAILALESAAVKSTIIKAAKAAANKSEALGDQLGKD